MSSITPVYGIPYPDGGDIVRNLPKQLGTFAAGVEDALNEVDRRATPEGSVPVVATTKAVLDSTGAVTGQSGCVTSGDDAGLYYYDGASWQRIPNKSQLDEITEGFMVANFQWQNTSSFVGDPYGGGLKLFVNRGFGLIFVNLASFKSTVSVGNYSVFQYLSGVKPSAAIPLGCQWTLGNAAYGKQAVWNTNGTITVVGGLSVNDRCIHTPTVVQIPNGVTFN